MYNTILGIEMNVLHLTIIWGASFLLCAISYLTVDLTGLVHLSVVPHPAEWAHPSPLVQPGHLLPPTALPQPTQVLIFLEDSTILYWTLLPTGPKQA